MAKLTDPGEMEIIRRVYFQDNSPRARMLDSLTEDERNAEMLDRQQHKQTSENQAR